VAEFRWEKFPVQPGAATDGYAASYPRDIPVGEIGGKRWLTQTGNCASAGIVVESVGVIGIGRDGARSAGVRKNERRRNKLKRSLETPQRPRFTQAIGDVMAWREAK